jgi:hypothetical protein
MLQQQTPVLAVAVASCLVLAPWYSSGQVLTQPPCLLPFCRHHSRSALSAVADVQRKNI